MKKIAYIAAALIAVVGCSKKEIVPETTGTNNLNVSLKVGTTRAVFDGESHIKFETGDAMYAAIATLDAPETGIEVTGPTGYGLSCVASLKIDENKLDAPVFNGTFKMMEEQYKADKYILYGIFPYSALYSTSTSGTQNLTSWTIKLPNEQKEATQTTWSNKADVMVVSPTQIDASPVLSEGSDKYYDADAGASVEFAHVFGFGQIKFADVPEEYSKLVVKSVTIETTDDSPAKYLAGQYTIDVTKPIDEVELVEGRSYNMSKSIVLAGDGQTTISDYTAWFVANPATYNVKITVSTKKANFIFERQGLEIRKGVIASPTVHFKEADTTNILDVVLKDGESWSMTKFSYSTALGKADEGKSWGDSGMQPMIFSISYPNTTNGVNPTTLYGDNGYVQKLASNLVNGGKIVLSSESEFKGMKYIKMNLGIYTNDVTADFAVSVDNGTKVVELGKYTITGTNKSTAGTDCYFKTTSETENGVLILTVDNLPKNDAGEYIYVQEYLGGIVINPTAALVVDVEKTKVTKDAGTNSFGANAYATEETPTVSVADDAKDWLTASYADGKVTYTVTENAGKRRSGVITVKLGGIASKDVTIMQAGATEAEYLLKVTGKDIYDVIKANEEAGTVYESGSKYALDILVNAVCVSDATKTIPVTLNMTDVVCSSSTEEYAALKGTITPAAALGNEITSLMLSSNWSIKTSSSSDVKVMWSADGSDWQKLTNETITTEGYSPKNCTVINENSAYAWFQVTNAYGFQTINVYTLEVKFIAD